MLYKGMDYIYIVRVTSYYILTDNKLKSYEMHIFHDEESALDYAYKRIITHREELKDSLFNNEFIINNESIIKNRINDHSIYELSKGNLIDMKCSPNIDAYVEEYFRWPKLGPIFNISSC